MNSLLTVVFYVMLVVDAILFVSARRTGDDDTVYMTQSPSARRTGDDDTAHDNTVHMKQSPWIPIRPMSYPLDSQRVQSPRPPPVIPPVNPNDPPKLPNNVTRKVLIIGGGLAGLSAATELSQRGYSVKIREAQPYLGGRMASRPVTIQNQTFQVDNSFISWMENNYQFMDLITRLNITKHFIKWNSVYYLYKSYKPEMISNTHSYPVDILDMLHKSKNLKYFEAIQVFFKSTEFVHFNYDEVYLRFDKMTFPHWAKLQGFPQNFYDLFLAPLISQVRNNNETVSAAEMIVYYYLHFLSTSRMAEVNRLIAQDNHKTALIEPWKKALSAKGVKFEMSSPFKGFYVDTKSGKVTGDVHRPTERFDYCILATGSIAARNILTYTRNAWSGAKQVYMNFERILTGIAPIKPVAVYKVMRVWFNKQLNPDRPKIILTPDLSPVNMIIQIHLIQNESMQWALKTKGSVVEFHLNQWRFGRVSDLRVWALTAPTIMKILPEISQRNFTVINFTVNTLADLPSFDVGQAAFRPDVSLPPKRGVSNLFLAGDWLLTSFPAAVGEKALSTGRQAANGVLLNDTVRQVALTVSSSHGPGWF